MGDMGVIWNGDGNRNHMTDPFNHYNGKVGIETRGASSSGFPKKSYDIELWDVNGNDIDSALCGFPKESDWVLSAQYTDKTLMRGMLTFELYRSMGWYAPRTKPVELIINGEYLGVYILMEKVKRDNDCNRPTSAVINSQEDIFSRSTKTPEVRIRAGILLTSHGQAEIPFTSITITPMAPL
jgi:hypothetical protein